LWIAAAAGRPDWDAIFAGYGAMVDYPGAHYWRQIAAYYPGAKCCIRCATPITGLTPPRRRSSRRMGQVRGPAPSANLRQLPRRLARPHAGPRLYDGLFPPPYRGSKATIPPERLLIYEAGQGWEPLCKFLGVKVPQEPYPNENTRAEFIARVRSGHGGPPR